MRVAYLILSSVSFFAVMLAHWLQVKYQMLPCTYCILQRYVFLALGVAFAVHAFRTKWDARWSVGLLVALGLWFVVRQSWSMFSQEASCGRDELAAWLNNLPWVRSLPDWFEVQGGCYLNAAYLLGVPFQVWSAVTLLGLMAGACWVACRTRMKQH